MVNNIYIPIPRNMSEVEINSLKFTILLMISQQFSCIYLSSQIKMIETKKKKWVVLWYTIRKDFPEVTMLELDFEEWIGFS